MERAHWSSRIGFIFAVVGSAVGLANIWRFPYIVGANGGAAFICVYLLCLVIIGFPVLVSELLIGRTTQTSPSGAFGKLGRSKAWGWVGKTTILTGFIVSGFYSAIAGWILGYFVEAVLGHLHNFTSPAEVSTFYNSLIESSVWALSYHGIFLALCCLVLYFGVGEGIERWNKVLMPMLFAALLWLVFKGVTLPNSLEGLKFLLTPDWSFLTPGAILLALGQAFFTLSLGQGTMVTYGSYLGRKESLLRSTFPIVLMDTLVSLFAAIAVFTIVFSVGMEPNSGPGLLFQTLPWVFSQVAGGYILAVLFFMLVVIAAITSEISALEPSIAYLIDEWGWTRHKAVAAVGFGVFLMGIPTALTFSTFAGVEFFSMNILDLVSGFASSILIPLGGLAAVLLVGWRWGAVDAIEELRRGAEDLFAKYPFISTYFKFCFKYCAPVLIIIVFLNALGVFS